MTTLTKHWQSRTKRDLIIEVWEALDCESVGARELEQIPQVLTKSWARAELIARRRELEARQDDAGLQSWREVITACDRESLNPFKLCHLATGPASLLIGALDI